MTSYHMARYAAAACLAVGIAAAAEAGWLDVPFVQQEEAGCGAASIAMVMQYWLRTAPEADAAAADGDRIYKILSGRSKKGISGSALQQYLKDHRFDAFVFDGELQDLRQHLNKGRPLVICIAPRGPRAPLHYVVVVGISNTSVWFHDPVRGKLFEQDLEHFEREWKVTDHWTLLAVPRQAR